MKMQVPELLKKLADGMDIPVFITGGYVRNSLAGLTPSDVDICGEAVLSDDCLPDGYYIHSTYKRMGTALIRCRANPEFEVEYTAFRKEHYLPGGSHVPESVVFGASIEEDALRRDFTVNSIYYDIKNGRLIDPLGGIRDIEKRVVRAYRPVEVFSSDGLRLMRLARIAAETGFSIDEKTKTAAAECSSLLGDISCNRIYEELSKILIADTKYGVKDAHYRGLCILRELNLLKYVIPELELMDGLRQNPAHHLYDALEHTFMTVRYVSPKNRLAALLHDIGKPAAVKESGKMFAHEAYGEKIAAVVLGEKMFNLPKKEARRVIRLVRWHMYDRGLKTKEGKIRLFVANNFDIIDDLTDLMIADEKAHGYNDIRYPRLTEIRKELVSSGAPLRISDLKVNGNDLLRMGYEGSEIKKELEKLLRECILNPVLNKRSRLLRKAEGDI